MAHTTTVQSPTTSPSKLSLAKSSMVTREQSTHSRLNFESDVAEKKPSSHTLLNKDRKGKENKPEEVPPTDAEKGKEKKVKKAKCGKTLWIVLAVIGWLFFVATLIFFLVAGKDLFGEDEDETVADSSNNQLCLSERCILSASQMIKRMNRSVDPCENFYQYACGGFISSTIIPLNKPMVWTIMELMETNQKHILSIFEESNAEKESESMKNARNFYKACMDTKKVEEMGDTNFKTWITSTFENWPWYSGQFDANNFDLTNILIKLGKLGKFPLVVIDVLPDLENSKKYSISMEQPSLLHGSKENFENNEKLRAYRDMLNNFVIALKVSNVSSNGDVPQNIQDVTEEVIDFEAKLSKILVPLQNRIRENFRRIKLKEIDENYSKPQGVDYNRFVQALFKQEGVNINDIGDGEIIYTESDYFDELTTLIEREDQRVVANYVLTDVLLDFSEYLPQKYKSIRQEYDGKIQGVQNSPRRDFECAKDASNAIKLAVGVEYAQRYFDKDSKQEILTMINEIQKSFNVLINETPWMDDTTKIAAKDKNDAITNIMGYDDIILDETYVKNRYIDYVFAAEKYFENELLKLEKDTIQYLKVLRKPVEYKDNPFTLIPQIVNAFFDPSNNKIVFPAGILQPQLFHKENPRYMNYGGIGTVIGHEITHGFDNKGRKYDKEGNIKPWWTNDSITAFVKEAKCFVNQYGKYKIPGTTKKVNGNLTLGENIADNGGFTAALQGYRNMVKKRQEAEPKLPGLATMSNEQLFFINQAQNWCVKYTKEFTENFLDKERHSPNEFRVKGIMMNSPDFAQVFNCPKRSPMNPDKKCRIWGPKMDRT